MPSRLLRLAVAVTVATRAAAQAPAHAPIELSAALGARIRVRLVGSHDYVTGSLEAIDDTLIVVRQRDLSLQLRLGTLASLDRSLGTPRRADNALWSGLAGALLGLYAGHRVAASAHGDSEGFASFDDPALGSIAGAALGVAVGALISRERWQPLCLR